MLCHPHWYFAAPALSRPVWLTLRRTATLTKTIPLFKLLRGPCNRRVSTTPSADWGANIINCPRLFLGTCAMLSSTIHSESCIAKGRSQQNALHNKIQRGIFRVVPLTELGRRIQQHEQSSPHEEVISVYVELYSRNPNIT